MKAGEGGERKNELTLPLLRFRLNYELNSTSLALHRAECRCRL